MLSVSPFTIFVRSSIFLCSSDQKALLSIATGCADHVRTDVDVLDMSVVADTTGEGRDLAIGLIFSLLGMDCGEGIGIVDFIS